MAALRLASQPRASSATTRSHHPCSRCRAPRGYVRLRSSRSTSVQPCYGGIGCKSWRPYGPHRSLVPRQRLQDHTTPVVVDEHREATFGCAAVAKPCSAVYQLNFALSIYDRFAIGRSLVKLGNCYGGVGCKSWRPYGPHRSLVPRQRLQDHTTPVIVDEHREATFGCEAVVVRQFNLATGELVADCGGPAARIAVSCLVSDYKITPPL